MTHLRILQSDSAIEQVSSAVIAKLYELATSGTLDNTSYLQGRLHTSATYLEYIDAIRVEYSDLYISTDKYYIKFKDPAFQKACALLYGDGVGMTMTDFLAVTDESPLTAFNNNTEITDMTEFKYFTNMQGHPTGLDNGSRPYPISGLTNLRKIEFPNQIIFITRVTLPNTGYHSLFYNTNNLLSVKFPTSLENVKLSGAPPIVDLTYTNYRYSSNFLSDPISNITEIYLPNTISTIYPNAFAQALNVKKVVIADGGTSQLSFSPISGYATMIPASTTDAILDLPSNLINIHKGILNGSRLDGHGITKLIIRATTPPTEVTGDNSFTTSTDPMNNSLFVDLYVPDNSVSAYSSNTIYSNFKHIYGLSLLPSDYSPTPPTNNV